MRKQIISKLSTTTTTTTTTTKLMNNTIHQSPLRTLSSSSSPSFSTPTHLLNVRRRPPLLTTIIRMNSSTTTTTTTTSIDAPELQPIFHHKKILRSKLRKSLKDMPSSQRSFEDDLIQQTVLDSPWFKSSRRVCAYISCRPLREVDTSKILSEILQSSDKDNDKLDRKTLYVPRVEDKNCHMRMLNITGMDDLIANSMNILEPAAVDSHGNEREDVMQASEPVDLMLLPGLAFDKCGRRLGRGGGYYDTFLSKYQQLANEKKWKQPLLVALSYSVQILDDGGIPITPNDVDIDALVTPAGIIPITSTAHHRMEQDV